MTKRRVRIAETAQSDYDAYIEAVRDRLTSSRPIGDVVEEVLAELNGHREAVGRLHAGDDLDLADRVRLSTLHPDNAAIESEWYAEKDEQAFERSKALQWLWRQFDRTDLAANVAFAMPFRQMLAKLLFNRAGDNLRIFRDVTMSYGHNIEVGDNCVIHDHVHLDDRGMLTIGDRVSLSEGAHIYSHDHDIVDQTEIINYETIIEDDARITYDAMVRGGVKIGENALIGGRAVVQSDIPAHHIAVGMPAKSIKVKPGWEAVARDIDDPLPDKRSERIIEYDLPEDIEVFDEFERTLTPPAE